jgi:hypothetical protein
MSREQSPGLREALVASLPTWLWSRVAVAILSFAGVWTAAEKSANVTSFRDAWDRWDVQLFWKVARWGYFGDQAGHYPDGNLEAVFPGMPILLRITHLVARDWVISGLLVSFVAGIVACACLWWLAADELGPDGGNRAVLYLVLAPVAVFLFAGYSESAWLAFALASWVSARRGKWAYAGVIGIGAGLVRVTGVFFALGLAVEYFTAGRARRGGRLIGWDAGWLLLPFAATGSYVVWLHSKTGDWKAYQHAQERGWGRAVGSPLEGFERTFGSATNGGMRGAETWQLREEMLTIFIGVVLLVVLLYLRRWGEATYVGTSVALFSATSWWASTARGALLWWPLFILLARLTRDRPWLHTAIVWVSAPLMAATVLTFTNGIWAG